MNQKGEPGEPDWNKDHAHGHGTAIGGWGGLLSETCKQSIETMKQWSGKGASVRSIPNRDNG